MTIDQVLAAAFQYTRASNAVNPNRADGWCQRLAVAQAAEDDLRAAILAYGKEQRERCVSVIEAHQVPVGNSSAGEMAAEWTMDALRDVRAAIRALGDA